jgi:hypothetical protein
MSICYPTIYDMTMLALVSYMSLLIEWEYPVYPDSILKCVNLYLQGKPSGAPAWPLPAPSTPRTRIPGSWKYTLYIYIYIHVLIIILEMGFVVSQSVSVLVPCWTDVFLACGCWALPIQ